MVDDVVGILEEQLPRYFRPIVEFQGILKAHGHGIGQAEETMDRLRDNFYIGTCDEPTIAHYEGLLGIDGRGMGLGERRKAVMMRYSMRPLFTLPFLREMLRGRYGEGRYAVDVDAVACTVAVSVTTDRQETADAVFDVLLDILPAHLQLYAATKAEGMEGQLYIGTAMGRGYTVTTLPEIRPGCDMRHTERISAAGMGDIMETILPGILGDEEDGI